VRGFAPKVVAKVQFKVQIWHLTIALRWRGELVRRLVCARKNCGKSVENPWQPCGNSTRTCSRLSRHILADYHVFGVINAAVNVVIGAGHLSHFAPK
jgi:hypothetical protein